jgi:hypothetical protein
LDEEEEVQAKDPDDEDAPISDEAVHEEFCQSCNQPRQDLGKEAADEYRHSRHWYKCGCGIWSIVIGPPQKPKEYDDLGAWHWRQRMMR